VVDRHDAPVADHHVGPPLDDGGDECCDVGGDVLVVGVGVDDDIGPELERRVDPRLEGGGEPLVVGELDDVVDAVGPRHVDRAVGRAVVDHQPLDLIDTRHMARQVGQRGRELVLFVEARDLDDELHRVRGAVSRPPDHCADGVPGQLLSSWINRPLGKTTRCRGHTERGGRSRRGRSSSRGNP
jgi:hypothetical protein